MHSIELAIVRACARARVKSANAKAEQNKSIERIVAPRVMAATRQQRTSARCARRLHNEMHRTHLFVVS